MPHKGETDPPIERMQEFKDVSIFIADDNDINQHLLQVYVSLNGDEYLVANDGQEAIEMRKDKGSIQALTKGLAESIKELLEMENPYTLVDQSISRLYLYN